MNQKHTPPGNGNANDKLLLVESINGKINECDQVMQANICKCTIVVEGLLNGQRLYKYFYFNSDSVVPVAELKNFFLSYMQRMANAALHLVDTDRKFLQMGNDIIAVDDFLKDYTAGAFPSINVTDYDRVNKLEVDQVAVITINHSIQKVKRIK
jgi:hypothetical protein